MWSVASVADGTLGGSKVLHIHAPTCLLKAHSFTLFHCRPIPLSAPKPPVVEALQDLSAADPRQLCRLPSSGETVAFAQLRCEAWEPGLGCRLPHGRAGLLCVRLSTCFQHMHIQSAGCLLPLHACCFGIHPMCPALHPVTAVSSPTWEAPRACCASRPHPWALARRRCSACWSQRQQCAAAPLRCHCCPRQPLQRMSVQQ